MTGVVEDLIMCLYRHQLDFQHVNHLEISLGVLRVGTLGSVCQPGTFQILACRWCWYRTFKSWETFPGVHIVAASLWWLLMVCDYFWSWQVCRVPIARTCLVWIPQQAALSQFAHISILWCCCTWHFLHSFYLVWIRFQALFGDEGSQVHLSFSFCLFSLILFSLQRCKDFSRFQLWSALACSSVSPVPYIIMSSCTSSRRGNPSKAWWIRFWEISDEILRPKGSLLQLYVQTECRT